MQQELPILVVAFDSQDHAVYHLPEPPPSGQHVEVVQAEEVRKEALLHFPPAELTLNQVASHSSGVFTNVRDRATIASNLWQASRRLSQVPSLARIAPRWTSASSEASPHGGWCPRGRKAEDEVFLRLVA